MDPVPLGVHALGLKEHGGSCHWQASIGCLGGTDGKPTLVKEGGALQESELAEAGPKTSTAPARLSGSGDVWARMSKPPQLATYRVAGNRGESPCAQRAVWRVTGRVNRQHLRAVRWRRQPVAVRRLRSYAACSRAKPGAAIVIPVVSTSWVSQR